MNTGMELIRQERERQVKAEGWSAAHDDNHMQGEMARAAICYAVAGVWHVKCLQPGIVRKTIGWIWPATWATNWWKPKDKIRNLVRAGALIAAEIDRLQLLKEKERVTKVLGAAWEEGYGPMTISRIKWALQFDGLDTLPAKAPVETRAVP